MTVRRMTAEDYAEAGVEPPPSFRKLPVRDESAPRCDDCGDEQGECGCRDE